MKHKQPYAHECLSGWARNCSSWLQNEVQFLMSYYKSLANYIGCFQKIHDQILDTHTLWIHSWHSFSVFPPLSLNSESFIELRQDRLYTWKHGTDIHIQNMVKIKKCVTTILLLLQDNPNKIEHNIQLNDFSLLLNRCKVKSFALLHLS